MVEGFYRRALVGISIAALMTASSRAASNRLGVPPSGFSSGKATVNGSSLHYVRGGRGPALILLHGWPEDWVEYRDVMPLLAKRFTVVAVDLPGIGRSGPSSSGYSTTNLASEIHGLAQSLNLDHVYIVGHDLGGLVTYAYVRRYSESLRGAMILDVPTPGIADVEGPSGFWHVGFIQAPKQLAEKLVDGRQAPFLGWFFDLGNFTKEKRDYYVQSYGAPQLHSAFEIYRAFAEDAKWNAAQTSTNSVPLTVVAGEKSFFNPMLDEFVKGYAAKGMTRVESARIPHAGHYVLDDNPNAVAEIIERYAGKNIP